MGELEAERRAIRVVGGSAVSLRVLVGIGIGLAIATVAATLTLGLNGDVAYVLGGFEVRGGGMGAAIGTFVHRPLAYRVVVGALDQAAVLVGLRPTSQLPYEAFVRLLADAAAVAAGWALFRGLAPRLGPATALATAAGAGLALVGAAAWDFLQPEWVAALLVVAAVGAALAPRSLLAGGVVAGGLLSAAVGVKLATAPYAVAGILLIALLDRRRAVHACGWLVGWLLVGVALTVAVPHERQWAQDMVALNANSPMRAGFTTGDLTALLRGLASKAAQSPAVLALPGTAALLVASVPGRAARAWLATTIVVAVVCALATVAVQGAYYLYHYALIPVLAAAVAGAAIGRVVERWPALAVGAAGILALAGIGSAAWLSRSGAWRLAHLDIAVAGAGGLALLGGVAALAALLLARPRSPERGPPGAAGTPAARGAWMGVVLLAALSLAPVMLPSAGWSLDPARAPSGNGTWVAGSRAANATLGDLSRRIGRDSPVLYLAYGTVPYAMGNPTDCAYPSPLFLRTASRAYVPGLPSYADNLACIDSGVPQWLILEPGWLDPATLPPPARARLDARYDCDAAIMAGAVLACPGRG